MGVMADQLSKKTIITLSNLLRACIFIGFSIYLKSHFNVTLVYIMMLCIGTAFSAFYATAFAFMRELVSEKDLMYANSTVDIVYEVGNVVGMGFAGLLIAWTSAETAILFNGITFLIATLSMICIPKKALCHGGKKEKKKIQLLADFKAGLSYLFQKQSLFVIYTIQMLILLTFLTAPLLLLPFSKTVLHSSVEQFGLIEGFASFGIIAGGLFMPWISERFGFIRTQLFFSVVLCITFLLFGYNHIIKLAMLLYFAIGFSGAIWPLIISKAQSLTDLKFQGRVQSTFNSLSGLTMLIFYFSMGAVSHYFGVARLYWIEVGITLLAIIFLWRSRSVFEQDAENIIGD